MQIKLNKDQINCNILLIAFILYYSQNVLFSFGIIGPLLAILIAVISTFYLLKIINKGIKLNSFAKLWLIFLLYQTIIYLVSGNHSRNFGIFQRMLLNTLPFFAFYYFIIKGILTRKHFQYFLLIALPLFIMNFIKTYSYLQEFKSTEKVVVTASAYMLIGLLPFVFMVKNKMIASLSLITIWFFMIQSNKKAVVFCGVIALIIFAYQNLIIIRHRFNFKNIVISIVVIIGIGYYSYNSFLQNEFLQKRMERLFEGGDNVREAVIEKTFNAWYISDHIPTYLFGLGFDSSRDITGISSHNDMVDAITSFGLIGFLLHTLIFYSLFKLTLKKGWNNNKRNIMLLFLGIALVTSLSNRWFTNAFPFMITMFLPYLLLTRKEPI